MAIATPWFQARRAGLRWVPAWVMALMWAAAAAAEGERADLIARRQKLHTQISELQSQLAAKVTVRDRLEGEVRDASREVARTARQLAQLRRAQRHDEREAKVLEQQRQTLRADIETRRDQLARQLRAAYMNSRLDYLKVLFNQQDPARVGRVLKYYDYYHALRVDQVTRLQAAIREADGLETAILRHRNDIEKRVAALQGAQVLLDSQLEQRRQLLVKFDTQVRGQGQELARAREDVAQLERLLATLDQRLPTPRPESESAPALPMAHAKGRLRWPVQGQVRAEFGRPRNAGGLRWSGILIEAPLDTPVASVADGQVAFADWMPGYGLVLIVDHGQGFLTLYAFNHTLTKEAGDPVEAGETVSTVGRGTANEASGLYFEIRQHGKPADPRQWLAKH